MATHVHRPSFFNAQLGRLHLMKTRNAITLCSRHCALFRLIIDALVTQCGKECSAVVRPTLADVVALSANCLGLLMLKQTASWLLLPHAATCVNVKAPYLHEDRPAKPVRRSVFTDGSGSSFLPDEPLQQIDPTGCERDETSWLDSIHLRYIYATVALIVNPNHAYISPISNWIAICRISRPVDR